MRMLRNEIDIQRGEVFSLDFAVRNAKGDPFIVFEGWQNPYLLITISPSLYTQDEQMNELYWLDLNRIWAEKSDKTISLEHMKRFISTEALLLSTFDTNEAVNNYGLTRDPSSDLYIGKYLFYVDANSDGNRVYKYFSGFDGDGLAVWTEYDFRIVKTFNTDDWINPIYLYDIKVVSGESVIERILDLTGTPSRDDLSDTDILALIDTIEDATVREEIRNYFLTGVPLMPTYRTEAVLLRPTAIRVGTNTARRY